MPANRRRGEVEAVFDGRPRRLVLTLGALAELESAFGVDDLTALAERLESGRLSARDATTILAAGLRGAGDDASEADVARMTHEDGAAGFVAAVAELLQVTFGGGEASGGEAGEDPKTPFPGTR
ncbi:gene transfer agent family protein [Hansschlegelia quercus]|uniref:Gene transfer agent family protein n=1 Tax=Hansschlegelia quercus TaxID=2528245 RepID=A0A4Q9GBL8_9HYPH|nr:gene transfer agent family protein [Hansschlegelia quercus]TBN48671.1 gene transfer agent family protein [Hansschlegelia quercus]